MVLGLLSAVTSVGLLANCADSHELGEGASRDEATLAEGQTQAALEEERPFAVLGHGMAFLKDGSVVPPSPELARRIQSYYLKKLEKDAPDVYARIEALVEARKS